MKHFELHELVDRATFEQWGPRGWALFNPDALEALDGLRDFFNVPIVVNNWWNGDGQNQYRGYRPENCPIGAKFSEHKKGNAFDCTIKGFNADVARQIIVDNQDDPRLVKIQRLEDEVHWVHFDCATLPQGKERIYLFKA